MSIKLKLEYTNGNQTHSSINTFPLSLTVLKLKERLELITGYSYTSMKLTLYDKNNKVSDLEDDGKLLKDYSLANYMVLEVIGSKSMVDSNQEILKYEMSDEVYDKLPGTVRDFKRLQRLGRFAIDPDVKNISHYVGNNEAESFQVGSRCEVKVPGESIRRGCVKFVGQTEFQTGYWIGVEFDEPQGKNDGSINGIRYFSCPPQHGGFVRPHFVTTGDFPEFENSDEEL